MQEVVAHVLEGFQTHVNVFDLRIALLHPLTPLRICPLSLMQFQSFVNVRGLSRRGNQAAARLQVVDDVVEHLRQVHWGDVFHYLPRCYEMELCRLAVERHLIGLGDVAGEEVCVGELRPVRAPVFEREIGAFQPDALPLQLHEVRDGLPSRASKVHHPQVSAIAELAAELFVHIENELLVGAVVDCGTFRGNVVWRFKGDREIRNSGEAPGDRLPAGAAERKNKVPQNLPRGSVNPNMDFVPNPAKLACEDETDCFPEVFPHNSERTLLNRYSEGEGKTSHRFPWKYYVSLDDWNPVWD